MSDRLGRRLTPDRKGLLFSVILPFNSLEKTEEYDIISVKGRSKMDITVREYRKDDLEQMKNIWNEVVKEGTAFPQEEPLDLKTAKEFFAGQSFCGVAQGNGGILGLYILHPNNIGRCGHIANASYAVEGKIRGLHIGEKLVRHSVKTAGELGFKILQFNAVVATNIHARHLYERVGFKQLGAIPGGFRTKDGSFEDICPYYIECK